MYEYLPIIVLFGIPAVAAILAGIYFWIEDHKKRSKHAYQIVPVFNGRVCIKTLHFFHAPTIGLP